MHQYQHIIWDWNGTLVDDGQLIHELSNAQLEEQGLAGVSLEQYRLTFKYPIMEFYLGLGYDYSKKPFLQLQDDFHLAYNLRRYECNLHQQVLPILNTIRASGRTQSILSAYRHDYLLEIIEHYQLMPYFTEVIGLEVHNSHGKIESGINWLTRSEIPAEQTILIGDTDHDWEVAQAMGIDCILISHGIQHPDRLTKCGVPVYNSLEPILKLLTI